MGIADQRGMLLYGQERYAMAADEFRKGFSENPNYVFAMAMLALSLNYTGKPEEALSQMHAAIAVDPEVGFLHYALASIMIDENLWTKGMVPGDVRYWLRVLPYRKRLRQAKRPAMEAIRLNSRNADFFALLSAIDLDLKHPRKNLEWAQKGLAVRADHVRCTHLRARALAKLGRAREAREAIKGVLALDPDDASTHSHGGWTHLQLGEPEEAFQHFNESVRLDPNDNDTHRGLHEARSVAARAWQEANDLAVRQLIGVGIIIFAACLLIEGLALTLSLPFPANAVGPIFIVAAIALVVLVIVHARRPRR